jgi:hypothetical protein
MSSGLFGNSRPLFKAREMKARGAPFWYIEIEWPDGPLEEIGQFSSMSAAWDWIARQSATLVASRERPS